MIRWTGAGEGHSYSSSDVFLLDTMGKLDQAYGLADVALIGRSFVPLGGSDPIPAVALGCPTVIGPHHDNFGHVVEELQRAGAISVSGEPMETAVELLGDTEARDRMVGGGHRVIRGHQGASRLTAALIMKTLAQYSS